MAWRSESWEDIVARAAKTAGTRTAATVDAAELAARAELVVFSEPRIVLGDRSVTVGGQMDSVEITFPQIYHLEPVDPWPSLALGWVERGVSHRALLTPRAWEVDRLAAAVEKLVVAYDQRVSHTMPRGWLAVPEIAWERVDALPGEKPEGPMMRGYRMAPEVPDPVVATRTLGAGAPSLWTWIWAKLVAPPRRVEPRQVILTRRYVYVRTRSGERLRLPLETLRTARRAPGADGVYVFARNTELLLVHQPDCPVTAALDARLAISER